MKSSSTWMLGIPLLLVCGCAGPEKIIASREATLTELTAAEVDQRAESIRRDLIDYIKRVASNCEKLEQYQLTLTREERRGLLRRLYGPERIQCWFRRTPFSVRMKWLDPEVKYGESTYVAGADDSKVRFVPRHGLLGLKPAITRIDPETSVVWGESRYPMTDFGLEQMMKRTLKSMADAGGDVIVRYEGLRQIDFYDKTVHFIYLEYPASRYRVPIQELYIDVASDLPAGTILRTADKAVEAAYVYSDLSPNVKLTDEDFRLDAERAATSDQ